MLTAATDASFFYFIQHRCRPRWTISVRAWCPRWRGCWACPRDPCTLRTGWTAGPAVRLGGLAGPVLAVQAFAATAAAGSASQGRVGCGLLRVAIETCGSCSGMPCSHSHAACVTHTHGAHAGMVLLVCAWASAAMPCTYCCHIHHTYACVLACSHTCRCGAAGAHPRGRQGGPGPAGRKERWAAPHASPSPSSWCHDSFTRGSSWGRVSAGGSTRSSSSSRGCSSVGGAASGRQWRPQDVPVPHSQGPCPGPADPLGASEREGEGGPHHHTPGGWP